MAYRRLIFHSDDVPETFRGIPLFTEIGCSNYYMNEIYNKKDHYSISIKVLEMSRSAADIYDAESIKKIKIQCNHSDCDTKKENRMITRILKKNKLFGKEIKLSL